jgi:cytochrome P450
VRIAPNELVFFTPQAFTDIYGPHQRNLEDFVKTDFQNRGKDLGGIVWEQDPVRHREVARKLSPAFSSRSIRAMEPLVHEYMDYFILRLKELGGAKEGVRLADWTNWLAMDLSADLTWHEKMHQMRDSRFEPSPECSLTLAG